MGKKTIYIKLINDVLHYRDSESDHGKTITTDAQPGDKILWTLDAESGINDITGINIIGDNPQFFGKGPSKKATDLWKAKIGHKVTGDVTYQLYYTSASGTSAVKTATVTMKSAGSEPVQDEQPPQIRIKG